MITARRFLLIVRTSVPGRSLRDSSSSMISSKCLLEIAYMTDYFTSSY